MDPKTDVLAVFVVDFDALKGLCCDDCECEVIVSVCECECV